MPTGKTLKLGRTIRLLKFKLENQQSMKQTPSNVPQTIPKLRMNTQAGGGGATPLVTALKISM
jgi:hypothetical protein